MGHAYEEYTDVYLKRRRGQFFTNRLVVNFLVGSVSPKEDDIILDPAGGSGGFLTASLRYVRRRILESKRPKGAKQALLAHVKERLHMVEISRRLVKVAKTAMILNGDGHGKMVQGDSLQPILKLPPELLASCGPQKPDVILTNPPFAGVGEGRITQIEVLKDFQVARRAVRDPKEYMIETADIAADGVPPEMLFFERCIQWLRPGGRLGDSDAKELLRYGHLFSHSASPLSNLSTALRRELPQKYVSTAYGCSDVPHCSAEAHQEGSLERPITHFYGYIPTRRTR